MKVAIVNHGLFPDLIGGMERHTTNLALYLFEAGIDVHVLVPEPNKSASYPFPVHHLPWPKNKSWFKANYEFSLHAGHWIEEHKMDVALGQGFNLWGYLKNKKIPCIYHPHGLEMFGSYMSLWEYLKYIPMRRLVQYHAKHSDCVISLGGKLTNILKEKAKVDDKKCIEIPNAISLKDFPFSSTTKISKSFLFVGRMAQNKGIDLLCSAIEKIKDAEAKFDIVGKGPLAHRVRELARKDSRVTYHESATEEALKHLLAKSECLLFTSRFEGMPTVILEAMACGCVILATDIGAVNIMVGDQNGILLEPTVGSICWGIEQILSMSEKLKKEMGTASRKIIENTFSWEKVSIKYIELFNKMRYPMSFK